MIRKKLKLVTGTINVKGVPTHTDKIQSNVSGWEGISGEADSTYKLPIAWLKKPPKIVIGNGSPMSQFQKPTEIVITNSSTDGDTDGNDSPISRLRK